MRQSIQYTYQEQFSRLWRAQHRELLTPDPDPWVRRAKFTHAQHIVGEICLQYIIDNTYVLSMSI